MTEARYRWSLHRRAAQALPPGDWLVWLILAGRGWGKTRTGAESVRELVRNGQAGHVALVGTEPGDVRDVMVEGVAGILAVSPERERPKWNPTTRRLTWPNGAMGTTFSAFNYDELRGPAHDLAWCDELCKWRYPQEAWDNLMFGLRVGTHPRCIVTTTPKPIALIRDLKKSATTVVTQRSMRENLANLAPSFRDQIMQKYEGTRLGRQELDAEILEDMPGALWKRDELEADRVTSFPQLQRVVVAIDPAATSDEGADETGITVCGLGSDGAGYVLDDRSIRGSPAEWGRAAIAAYSLHRADRIVAETNNGGEMVEYVLRTIDRSIPFRAVHASRGKQTRAEPIAALYEQHRVHHVGTFADLEDQLCQWVPGDPDSPDRLDALVWGFTDLMLGSGPRLLAFS